MPSSPCSPHHCVCHGTEIHSRVTPKDSWFLQVERGLAFIKFSLKTIVAFDQVVPCDIFQKELETLVAMLDVPKEIGAAGNRIVAFHSHWIPLGNSDLIGLRHRLSSQPTCK